MEIIDLYEQHRRPLGKTLLRGQKLPEDTYRAVVHICLMRSDGFMLIQQRQDSKSIFPGIWDLSAGGQLLSGETPEEGVCRELQEELGVLVKPFGLRPRLTIHFDGGFDDIFLIDLEPSLDALRLQKDEVKAVCWADCETILQRIREGSFVPYHEAFIRLLFTLQHQEGSFDESCTPTGAY